MLSAADNIPQYLRQFTTTQQYDLYSAIDHASWRYIMRVSKDFFKDYAHSKYMEGIEATGITIDSIPKISEMDEKLKRFGWRAVSITGFIPPAIFLEFLAYKILPIACDMRTLEHLEYTPSPDIVHEAAGHAPILSDRKFASYLSKFGEIARKAIFAKEDLAVYEAILHLSEIKEDPSTQQREIDEAYNTLQAALEKVTYASEATQLSRLGWWSTEYGLIKKGDKFLIYGAGLLSSVGESYNSIHNDVPKKKLTIECTQVHFDITKPQPQLFYIESFDELENVIEELASTMAFRHGGLLGLEKAQEAGTVTTTEFDSGLQISGVVSGIPYNKDRVILYIQYSGPTQLSYDGVELENQGPKYHKEGFGTPIGLLKKVGKSPADLTDDDLEILEIYENEPCRLEFETGTVVEGVLRGMTRKNGKILIMSFDRCTVSNGPDVLFKPEWGMFDMACGSQVVSVFGGAADRWAYQQATSQEKPKVKPQTSNRTEENRNLVPLYEDVRKIREMGVFGAGEFSRIQRIVEELRARYPDDWLLRLEILEVLTTLGKQLKNSDVFDLSLEIRKELVRISKGSEVLATLVKRGIALLQ